MELKRVNSKPLEFKYEDVVFFVKPVATEEDRMEVQLSGISSGPKLMFSTPDYCKAIIRAMVTGWKGVKLDGQEVPYSFEMLADFPAVKGKNVFIELGSFIMKNTDIRNREKSIKKD